LDVEAGQDVELDTVLACSDGTELKIGMPYVKDAKVTLTIVGHKRGKKLINFKKKRRKGYARRIGHRQELTVATVKAIA
jgi:large subunit ribosomal protein L21